MTSQNFSILKASKLTGKSRTTIAKHMKNGTLTFDRDATGNKVISAAELDRVYGLKDPSAKAQQPAPPNSKTLRNEKKPGPNQAMAEELLKMEREERVREREQLRSQIDSLEEALSKSQEGQNRITLLLEYQSKADDAWQSKLRELETTIANRVEVEREKLKEAAEKQIAKVKRDLEAERNKPLWAKLFG